MPRTQLFVTAACALGFLGTAGCGGDDEPAERSRATDTNAQAARTDTGEQRTRKSERAGKAGGSKKEAEERTRRRGKRKEQDYRGKNEPDDRRRQGPGYVNPSKDEPRAGRGGRRLRRDPGPPTDRAFRALTGAAFKRCVTRAARQRDPDRRLRAQARCVGLTPRQMRRQIRRGCRIFSRKARNRRAAERRCLKAALG